MSHRCICGIKIVKTQAYMTHLHYCKRVAPWINEWAGRLLDSGDVERRVGMVRTAY